MKMLFKQRMFSWFDSYDVYDEVGNVLYVVKGQLAWGHCFKIFDANGSYLGKVEERVFSFLPKFEIYLGDLCIGCISKEFSFLLSSTLYLFPRALFTELTEIRYISPSLVSHGIHSCMIL